MSIPAFLMKHSDGVQRGKYSKGEIKGIHIRNKKMKLLVNNVTEVDGLE